MNRLPKKSDEPIEAVTIERICANWIERTIDPDGGIRETERQVELTRKAIRVHPMTIVSVVVLLAVLWMRPDLAESVLSIVSGALRHLGP
jgi:hypothetical protein